MAVHALATTAALALLLQPWVSPPKAPHRVAPCTMKDYPTPNVFDTDNHREAEKLENSKMGEGRR